MMMASVFLVVGSVLAGALTWVAARAAWGYFTARGARVVTCPETHRPAAVEIDAHYAALTAPFDEPDIRLRTCTRWPERQNCGQECLRQIENAPEGCLARTMLSHWYAGKSCAVCGKEIGEIHWNDHKPGLMSPEPEQAILEWSDVPPNMIPDVLQTHQPVCWNCVIAGLFRERHRELITDRTAKV
jgi:hypothetical protein